MNWKRLFPFRRTGVLAGLLIAPSISLGLVAPASAAKPVVIIAT